MALAILVLITALCISAVAIYYSVAGLVAIFAAAAVPIMIMGGILEIGKLVTAVWLHKYWKQATWWLKSYLSVAVVVLMFITSMGIFGFLSKAHIEQTSAGEESVAKVEQIENEIVRLNAVIDRADDKIEALETSGTGSDANIQAQIDKEQDRIDKAFDRIKPAIEQQNKIITDARGTDASRTKPYEDQLTSITAEILRLETSAKEYETKIENLDTDSSGVEPLLAQIAALEEEIIRVTNQLQSKEQGQVRAGQAIIGVTSDGLFGGNTRTALAKWVQGQRDRITQIQGEVAQVRKDATSTVDAERVRLAEVVKDIRTVQIPALKERELVMLGKIDEVRQTESPVIQTARDEIQRLRESAEAQVANSQALIERLRSQLADTSNAEDIDKAVDEQLLKIKTAEAELDTIIEEKYKLEGEYRKLEAEVGPIKYIAEFVYGEAADNTMLEEAVRWVIMIIIFVFDPLAVLLLIASQYTFDYIRRNKDDGGERLRLERQEHERARAQRIIDNPGFDVDAPEVPKEEEEKVDVTTDTTTADDSLGDILSEDDTTNSVESDTTVEQSEVQTDEQDTEQVVEKKELESSEESNDINQWNNWVEAANKEAETEAFRAQLVEEQDHSDIWTEAKRKWKQANPNLNVKDWKQAFISGRIKELPWAPLVDDTIEDMKSKNEWPNTTEYVQNEEQSESSVWKKIQDNNNK
jgi:outer membrane murein-binding lipoprotein Lpp